MDVSIITLQDLMRVAAPAAVLQHNEGEGTLYAEIPGTATVCDGDAIGFFDIDGRYRLFEITSRTLKEPDGIWQINGVDKAIAELMDDAVTELRARNESVSSFVGRLLNNTRYSIGAVTASVSSTMTAYYESVWSALVKVQEAYNVRCIPYYSFSGGLVSGRYVDIVPISETYRGRIFELGDDLSALDITYDDSEIKTALYGRGKGVEIDGGDASTDPTYGRRLTFADVVWSTADGDPADKPLGQEWIGDSGALTLYGRGGRHRFGFAIFDGITDAEELLQATWEQLQKQKTPRVTINATVQDTERMFGRTHEAVRLYDAVLVRMARTVDGERVFTDISAKVMDVIRDYIRPEATRLTIGNARITAGDLVGQLATSMANYESKASVWDRAKAFDLQGAMDVMNNQITSSVGHWYTDESGAIMFVTADGTKAMRLTGAGWQIASQKIGGVWQWRTAATGSGIVADEITTGTLNAGLVTVGGTGTTLDGTSIEVKHPTISNTAKTLINANGMQILNSNSLLGGIVALNGVYTAVMQALYTATYPNLKVDLGEFQGLADAVYGLLVKYNNTSVLRLGAGFIEGTLTTAEIIADKGLVIASNDEAVSLSAPHASITVDDDGDIKFKGTKNGAEYTVSLHDIYHLID